jgi:hypothetical protein
MWTRELLPLILVAANALMWGSIAALSRPLPLTYFEARDARVQRSGGGISFALMDDVDPMLILGEREVIGPWWSHGNLAVHLAALANLPACLAVTVVHPLPEPAFGGPGWRAASWRQTAAFGIVSSVQWWAIGSGLRAFLRWRHARRA